MPKNEWDEVPEGRTGCELKGLVDSATRSGAVHVSDLAVGDVLTVETASGSAYRFQIVDSARGLVTDTSAKPLWVAGEEVRLSGSRVGQGVLSQWRVMLGHRLEIMHTWRRREEVPGVTVPYAKVTTPIRRVLVNDVQLLPPLATGYQS